MRTLEVVVESEPLQVFGWEVRGGGMNCICNGQGGKFTTPFTVIKDNNLTTTQQQHNIELTRIQQGRSQQTVHI